jgi:uncharacterized membrane protein
MVDSFKNYLCVASLSLFSLILVLFFASSPVHAQSPIICAVLYYSPTCPHCHKVMTEDLPSIIEKYGDQINIFAINIQTGEGNQLFVKAIEYFEFPKKQTGVPMLVVGDTVLFGSVGIPEKFPGLIEEGLAVGGIDCPEIPGLIDFLLSEGIIDPASESADSEGYTQETQEDGDEPNLEGLSIDLPRVNGDQFVEDAPTLIPEFELISEETKPLSMIQLFMQDVVGNSLSVLVLIGMIFVVFWVSMMATGKWKSTKPWPTGIIFLIIGIGIFVSTYLSYVESTHSEAVCGPVGDCNTVQQSPYAYLFGIVPIGVLGVIGYSLIGINWLLAHYGPVNSKKPGYSILFIMITFGMLFSMYLTFLEPFVIGATCAWCLTSAVVMSLLTWNASISFIRVWK